MRATEYAMRRCTVCGGEGHLAKDCPWMGDDGDVVQVCQCEGQDRPNRGARCLCHHCREMDLKRREALITA